MKIANTDRETFHNFWATWGISMKLSGKMCLMIISKVTKSQGFILSLENTFFEKPYGGEGGSNWPPSFPSRFKVKSIFFHKSRDTMKRWSIIKKFTSDNLFLKVALDLSFRPSNFDPGSIPWAKWVTISPIFTDYISVGPNKTTLGFSGSLQL